MIVMTMEQLTLVAVSLMLIVLILVIWLVICIVKTKKKINHLTKQVGKRKSAKRKKRQRLTIVTVKLRRLTKQVIFLTIILVVVSLVAGYSRFYQLTNLATADSENIVNSYYLLTEASKQLGGTQITEADRPLNETNYQQTAVQLASYAPKKASTYSSKEGQLRLNRYYRQLGQLGMNMSSQSYDELLTNDTLLESYTGDIRRIERIRKEVFALYKINEESLQKSFKANQE